jgi:two-component system CheB/CheR fusion protein
LSGVLVPLAGSSEEGYAKIARDLTQTRMAAQERKALPSSERSLRARLQSINDMKDEFLAVMSHELKNPLNLIALHADLLARQPETQGSETLGRIARTIGASVRSQAQLIDELLDLSRPQTGKLALHLEDMRVDEAVERTVGAVRANARERGLKVMSRPHQPHEGPCSMVLHFEYLQAGRSRRPFSTLL